ncbi:MAG: dTDP-4-dehydrorhamnose reductase [Actinomycetota bacterium]|nr:dTDP-4-dehydrorhamnose reductase [Actinomycetota bacterium]
MRILITGGGGMLGQDVARAGGAASHEVIALSHAELDITDAAAVHDATATAKPEVVINCAAWTNVDGAEEHEREASEVNGTGAGHVARAATAAQAWTLHVSSDYVFDGSKHAPYLESDPTCPLSAYGRSKLAGELEVAREAPTRHTVVRSSWLFGVGGPCFPATILRLAAERDELSVVDDQLGCPTFTLHLAGALLALAQRRPRGVVHVAGGGSCSWFQFATEIVHAAGLQCDVRPCHTEDMPRPAPRPAYSVLVSERGDAPPALPHWREGLAEYMAARVSP